MSDYGDSEVESGAGFDEGDSLFGSESDGESTDEVEDDLEAPKSVKRRRGNGKAKAKAKAKKGKAKSQASAASRGKKSRFEQLMESAKKETERQRACEMAARMQIEEERKRKAKKQTVSSTSGNSSSSSANEAEREAQRKEFMRQAVVESRRRISTRWNLSGAILSSSGSLKERELKEDECKIERHVMVRRHNFFPFFEDAARSPEKFFSEETDLCCVWCTEPCNCVPVPCPVGYEKGKGVFKTFGQFCRFECMLSYARERRQVPLARFMMKVVYGVPISQEYGFAPSRLVMEKFGGPLSVEAYRGTVCKTNLEHKKIALPFIPVLAGLEEIERIKTIVSEFGDASKVSRVVNARLQTALSAPIDNTTSRNMQRSEFSKMPTLEQQLERSEQELRLQLQETGLGKSRKRSRTMMDFMRVKKSPG